MMTLPSTRYSNSIRPLLLCAMMLIPSAAFAQIGPDLRPPGLPKNHPINAYSLTSEKQTSSTNSWDLNASEIVFSAAKKRQLISEAPSTIHVITDRDIALHGYRSLPEILRHIPGVQTQTTQSQFHSVMIRGLVGTENNNSRILWLQNGVPMNDVRDSGIWIDETYPVELIKRIEVVLGPGSALYGSGAFQGVINIFTKDPSDINKTGEYRLVIQNNLTFKASAIAAYNADNGFGILGHVSANTTQGPGLVGDYVYTNYLMDQAGASIANSQSNNNFRFEKIDNNSDKHWYNINLKMNYKQFKLNTGFTDIYAGADGSEIVPGVPYAQPTAYDKETNGFVESDFVPVGNKAPHRFNRREFFADFFYEDKYGSDVSLLALLSYRMIQYNHKHYGGYTSEENLSLIPVGTTSGESHDIEGTRFYDKVNFETLQHKLYALAQVQWNIFESNELIAGAVAEYHNIHSPEFSNGNANLFKSDLIATSSPRVNAQQLAYITPSVFIQDEQRFWNNRIILTAGARYDAYKASYDLDSAPSWRLAFLAKWTSWMNMRISYGYSFKEPSLFQLYVDTFDYVGDTRLKHESLHNVELSFLFTPLPNLKFRLDGFTTLMNDLIIIEYSSLQGDPFNGITGRYYPNQDYNANLYGFEASVDSTIKQWNLYAHYNFLYSTLDKTDKDTTADSIADSRITEDAMHRFRIGASYVNDKLSADLAMFVVAGTPKTRSAFPWQNEKYATPAYALFQPQITFALPANLGFMLSGSIALSENMTTSPTWRYYYEKEGVPVDRYTFTMALQYPFRN